jgi:hypothetical protein
MGNLALIYRLKKYYKKSESLYVKTLPLMKKIFGSNGTITLSLMYNMGCLYATVGRYNDALVVSTECLKLQQVTLGDDDDDTIKTMSNVIRLQNIISNNK